MRDVATEPASPPLLVSSAAGRLDDAADADIGDGNDAVVAGADADVWRVPNFVAVPVVCSSPVMVATPPSAQRKQGEEFVSV